MSNKNLFKEAIADAKAVREAALANAKAALEETLTPKLQSMLAAKLNEIEELEEEAYEDGEVEEGMYPEDTSDEIQDRYRATGAALEEEELEEDFDLSAILAELEDEEEVEKKLRKKGGYKNLNKGSYTGELSDEDEKTTLATAQADTAYSKLAEAKEEDEDTEETEDEESEDVASMSFEDLKALIKDIVSQEIESEEEETPADEEAEEAGKEMSMDISDEEPESMEEIDLEELLAELDGLEESDNLEERKSKKSKHEKEESAKEEKEEHASKKEKKEPSEMEEALNVINTLRSELNEVNLLNAKLLYVNKIFKAKNLTESQKLQVIASFDKATTAKEAKVVFESLNNTLTATPAKKAIKESLGFASKAAGVAPSKVIVESNDVIARMQKLANIK
jgi:hypothetical protein